MTWAPTTPATPSGAALATRWKHLAVAGGVLMVGAVIAALVVAGVGFATVFGGMIDALSEPMHGTPVDLNLKLTGGRWLVYERVADSIATAPDNAFDATTLVPGDVSVQNAVGILMDVSWANDAGQLNNGSGVYVAVVEIRVPADGTYRIRITPDDPLQVIIAPSMGTSMGRVSAHRAAWGWSFTGCLIAFVVGAALLGVAWNRRPRTPTTLPGGTVHPAPLPMAGTWPPGWYPDPWRPGGSRYWDGYAWTAHQL